MIAGRLPGRTDNEVKNYWNSHLKKKLMRMGIDPKNHRLGGRAPDCKNNRPLMPPAAAPDNGSASKTISCSLPDLNLNEAPSVEDQQMQLLTDQANSSNSHKELKTAAPFTTLLLFG